MGRNLVERKPTAATRWFGLRHGETIRTRPLRRETSMKTPPKHHKPLPKRFAARLSEDAYAELRRLAEASGLGNNYVLTVLLEDADRTIDRDAFLAAVADMKARHARE